MIFWIDEQNSVNKTYEELVADLNSLEKLNCFVYTSSSYEILLNIFAGLLSGINVTLLDKDFSIEEVERLGIEPGKLNEKENIHFSFNDYNEILNQLDQNKETSAITLFTSGTTGRPKKVHHTLKNLSRNVRCGEKFENNIWAFAYNLTHFAGLQVFLQAAFNRNPLIYVFENSPNEIIHLLQKHNVTNISATPSFYRMMLPLISEPINSLKKVTMGGEKFDSSLKKIIEEKFPSAKVLNIYASTEAGSLFNSVDETFSIENENEVRINENNELLLHKNLLGKSESFVLDGDWFNTGDVVEKLDKNLFRFVARKKEFVNIGGYKVNPLEVEDKIKELRFINDVKVLAKDNSLMGQILIASIVLDKNIDSKEAKREINKHLKYSLQKWKIPSIYNFTDKLSLTRTGKKEIQ